MQQSSHARKSLPQKAETGHREIEWAAQRYRKWDQTGSIADPKLPVLDEESCVVVVPRLHLYPFEAAVAGFVTINFII
jgi:hypothetical protein